MLSSTRSTLGNVKNNIRLDPSGLDLCFGSATTGTLVQ